MTQTTPRGKRIYLGVVAAIMLLGLLLRLNRLGADPLWYDEICSLQSSTGHGYQALILPANQVIDLPDTVHLSNAKPLWKIWASAMDHDAHPPIYPMILRLFRDAFGTTEATVRMPGAIASVAAIGLCAAVGSELFGTVAGCWAALLMAVAAPQIYFSHEARSYTMFPTFCLLAAYAVLRLDQDDGVGQRTLWRWTILLSASSLAAVLTHYYSVLPLMAIAGYAMIRLRGHIRLQAIGAMFCAALVFALVWGPHLLRQQSVFAINQIGVVEQGNSGGGWAIEQMPLAVLRELMGIDITSEDIAFLAASIIGMGGLVSLANAVRRKDSRLLFCHAWVLIALGTLAILDYRRHTEFLHLMRYLMPAAPGIFLLITGTARSHRIGRHLLPAIAVCLCFIGWPQAYGSWKGDWRRFAHDLEIARQPGDCYVFFSNNPVCIDWGSFDVQYYVRDFHGPAVFIARPADAQLLQQLEKARSIWLIVQPGIPREKQFAYLPLNGRAQVQTYPGIGDVWHIFPEHHE
jgi:uncharacterized membrane protein